MITNPGTEEIYFSIGAHPAFAVPLGISGEGERYEDYYLEFSDSGALQRYTLENGLIGKATTEIPLQDHKLRLQKELFRQDAIVLKNLPDTEIRLRSEKHQHGLDFGFHDFPFFGIWAAKDAPFVCLEPWCGIADSVDHNQQLTEKEGIICLPPNEIFERQWTVRIY
jgi:galactose mutarotase-like enzyme